MAPLPEPRSASVEAIYRAYEAKQDTGFRYHLGASLIGKECERALWYDFRWATRSNKDGRMLRLLDTGNHAEARFVADLRAIGCEVYDRDPANPEKQISVRDEFGHFGGSLDGMAIGIPEAPKTWHVCEFKTHGSKSFAKLVKDGVAKAKPQHFAQMHVYMHLTGVDRAFYLAVNKDTDELYSERVRADADFATRLIAKARRVIQAPVPPGKISNDPSWFGCKFCDHHAVCHGQAKPERHCRSCMHSTPVQGGTWTCANDPDEQYTGGHISREQQERGCTLHRYIPALVKGEQTNVLGNDIIYTMHDGNAWVDDGGSA